MHRPFAYSKSSKRPTRMIVPGTFGLLILGAWSVFSVFSREGGLTRLCVGKASSGQPMGKRLPLNRLSKPPT